MTKQEWTTPHLTENELEEVLLGLESSASEDHLAGCSLCRDRIDEFRHSLTLFNDASLAWSQAKSNSLNRDLTEHRIPFRMSVRTVWVCASVLIVLLAGLTGSVERHRLQSQSQLPERAAVQVQPSSEGSSSEIASDNAMMEQIDAAINTPEPSPNELYGHAAVSSDQRSSHSAPVRN